MQRMKCCLSSLWVVDAVDGDDPFEGPGADCELAAALPAQSPTPLIPRRRQAFHERLYALDD